MLTPDSQFYSRLVSACPISSNWHVAVTHPARHWFLDAANSLGGGAGVLAATHDADLCVGRVANLIACKLQTPTLDREVTYSAKILSITAVAGVALRGVTGRSIGENGRSQRRGHA